MNDFLIYILKSTISISLLYLVFRILMRKETFFKLNRALLLSVVVCSAIIPLLYLPQIMQPAIQNEWMPRLQNPEITPIAQSSLERSTQTFTVPTEQIKTVIREEFPWIKLLQTVYLAGILITLLILIYGIVSILTLFRKAQFMQMDGFRLLIIDDEIPPFSFGRFVIISQSDYDAHQQAILAHEEAHIRLNHFFDLALLETTKILQWFNPVIYWLICDMKEIHEFQADQYTLNKGIDVTQYQILIIQKSVGSQRFALANSFNHCQIKKRIIMMNKQKTSKARRWKVATFLPLLALLLMAFSKTGEKGLPSQNPSSTVSTTAQELGKQWTEADFGKIDFTPTKTFWALPILLNSKSQLKVGNEITDWEEAAKQIRKFLDYNNTSEEMKPAFEKIIINGQERMAQKYTALSIESDVSTSKTDYQNFLNSIGKVVFEIRQQYASEIYKTNYNNLSPSQRTDIIRLIPANARFNKIPIVAPETKENQPSLYIEVRAEGIFVLPDKNVVTIDELKEKAKLFAKGNGSFVDVRTAVGLKDEQVIKVTEALKGIEKLNVRYLTFDPVYDMVEQMAEFSGGTEGIREWLSKNITYPETAKANGLEGKVYISLVINSKGKVVFSKVVRGLSPEFDAEALKLVTQMPEWKPAIQNGVPVSVSYTIPIKFSISQQ